MSDDTSTPRTGVIARAPVEDRWLERTLDIVQKQNERQTEVLEEVREEVKEIREEARQTFAREVDCLARRDDERTDRSLGVKRAWDHFAVVDTRLDRISEKIHVIEGSARESTGAHKVVEKQKDILLKILVPIIVGLIMIGVGWLIGRCGPGAP